MYVNNRPLTEYRPPDDEILDDHRKVTRYIEAAEGQEFTVKLDFSPTTRWVTGYKSAYISIDGRWIDNFSLKESTRDREGRWRFTMRRALCREGNRHVKRTFMFKNMVTTDDACRSEDAFRLAKELGTIKIEIFDATRGEKVPFKRGEVEERDAVPEKALKGRLIELAVGLGGREVVRPGMMRKNRKIGPVIAVFEFKYRTKRALQMLDIIPTTSEAEGVDGNVEERELHTLNLEEARRLVGEYRQSESGSQALKREVNVKRENEAAAVTSREYDIVEDGLVLLESKKPKNETDMMIEVLDLR